MYNLDEGMNTQKALITASLLALVLTGCDTLNRDLTYSRLQRQYDTSLQEQKEQQMQMRIGTALQRAAGRLTMCLYDQLGKGGEAYNTFDNRNVKYDYQKGEASVDIQVYWNRTAKKQVVITGYLQYDRKGQIYFVCTGADGIRTFDRGYIRKLSKGIYI